MEPTKSIKHHDLRNRDFDTLVEKLCKLAMCETQKGNTILAMPITYDPQEYFSDNPGPTRGGRCFVGTVIFQENTEN